MRKHFLGYKESLELKELGFNEFCYGHIDPHEYVDSLYSPLCMGEYNMEPNDDESDTLVACPMYFQAFDWFREEHGLFVQPSVTKDPNGDWYWFSIEGGPKRTHVVEGSDEYGISEHKCIIELIEIIKNKLLKEL